VVDAVLGLVIAVAASVALVMAVEVSERSFARKRSLNPGLTNAERQLLDRSGFSGDHQGFAAFLANQQW